MLRIIAGQLKGRRLRTPKGKITRPTSDRVREALFNILGPRVVDSLFLDLFAGSGAVGLEALSRGAKKVVFVENNRYALNCLLSNLKVTGFESKGQVIAVDVRRALLLLKRQKLSFDLIYADPPYDQNWVADVLPTIAFLLKPAGLLIMEGAASKTAFKTKGLFMVCGRAYGDTALNFYQIPGGTAGGDYKPN